MVAWPEQTGGMGSKYDEYWEQKVTLVRDELGSAASAGSVRVGVPGLRDLGARRSWYGFAEVRGRTLVRHSMAHMASLGKIVAASGICDRWPDRTFLFTVDAAGRELNIRIADGHRPRSAAGAELGGLAVLDGHGPARAPAAPGSYRAGMVRRDSPAQRQADVDEFYLAMSRLADRLGGPRRLAECTGKDIWPRRGVYFFYEDGQVRSDGSGRVVRVGTHALTAASGTTLWGRLRQHRGNLADRRPLGGNHRASVFRRHVGAALIRRDHVPGELLRSWLDRRRPAGDRAGREAEIESQVSRYIGAMPVLWLGVPAPADRAYLERNSIALLSCLTGCPDTPSPAWLGRDAVPGEIGDSGLWNVEHVQEDYDPGFLRLLSRLAGEQA